MSSYRKEPLTGQMHVYVSENHRFGTDAFLLANFSNWRKKTLSVTSVQAAELSP